jgi:hypothetical protein
MTTTTETRIDECVRCQDYGTVNQLGYCWRCIEVACAGGDGESVGLPVVPEDELDAAIAWAAEHIKDHNSECDHCLFCQLLDDACGECGTETIAMGVDDEHHITVDAYVMTCCEGFHTPAIRWAALAVNEG